MDRVYKKIEIVGVSPQSFEEAIKNAIDKASSTLHNLAWFEVVEQHGRVQDGKIAEFQVVVKVAFKLD
ncbi:MAG TPA: dodecin flavoprotein [Deltaproteobacteria bacterium]|nr:MAG: dodecin flavoprotein [Deltaproteobacteria bacterium GWA2_55_82]OGQ64305.1 MAG: dodecin flavoprotein [Deltaproteobacteria bacterium RIFCSPLOWO2_02_FULL_55_12]OIJ74350.1 MAG: dodecin flavoprotein [Deltaproteobacteria bacterium GWC2_55_46]HBG46992.1 dodecin flavoprotein [Deltaproteobacteria bacterium]HCY10948.1 dodecin flavoprotein [Deltaproteobacteria bacterium]